jgi:hypothetical protein
MTDAAISDWNHSYKPRRDAALVEGATGFMGVAIDAAFFRRCRAHFEADTIGAGLNRHFK